METSIIKSALDSLFTMTFTVDRNLRVLDSSERLRYRYPAAVTGAKLDDLFDLHRPRGIASFDDILKNSNSLYLLIARNRRLALRGQVIAPYGDASEWFVFVGSPWLSWMNDNCPDIKIELSDFPRHDSQMDQNFFLATQQNMVADLEKTNEALLQARDEAEHAKQTQSDFFAIMSHEMRTPLNGVITALGLIPESPDPKIRDELVTVAASSANNLLSVINYVLDYSKMDAGQMALETEDFDLQEAVHAVSDILAPRASTKGISFEIVIDERLSRWVNGDGSKIRQILINLASNAVKFTDTGSVAVRVLPGEEDAEIRFEIEDTGVGIPVEQQARIFDAFWTSHTHTPQGEANTGLGLNICKRLAELLDGSLGFSSQQGQGSCFTLSVPLPPARTPASALDAGVDVDLGATFSGDVLLVDDNQTNLLVGRMLLERMGLSVRTASDGPEAIELARAAKFDLILMDITMPEMDGETATRQLRDEGMTVPIVALTAHVGEGRVDRYLNAGMQDVVHKPINKAELIRAISKFLAPTTESVAADETGTGERNDLAVLDKKVISVLVDSIGEENFQIAYEVFVSETELRISNLLAAWVQRDLTLLTREAHTISSSVASFGATELGHVMKSIEQAGRNQATTDLIRLMPDVESAYARAMQAFDEYTKQS